MKHRDIKRLDSVLTLTGHLRNIDQEIGDQLSGFNQFELLNLNVLKKDWRSMDKEEYFSRHGLTLPQNNDYENFLKNMHQNEKPLLFKPEDVSDEKSSSENVSVKNELSFFILPEKHP